MLFCQVFVDDDSSCFCDKFSLIILILGRFVSESSTENCMLFTTIIFHAIFQLQCFTLCRILALFSIVEMPKSCWNSTADKEEKYKQNITHAQRKATWQYK